MKYGVFLFNTTTAAIQAQKVLTTKAYSSTLIPAPRQFNSASGNPGNTEQSQCSDSGDTNQLLLLQHLFQRRPVIVPPALRDVSVLVCGNSGLSECQTGPAFNFF
jgi:Protein of unknown function (DUF3343)